MSKKLLDEYSKYWGWELSDLAKVEYKPEHDEMVRLAAVTMLYKIADEFEDGRYRKEILKQWGVEV